MHTPDVFLLGPSHDEGEASKDLAGKLHDLDAAAPFVLHSTHGERLAAAITTVAEPLTPERGADQDWAMRLGSHAKRAGADSIVAIGGGRLLDVGKLAAARAGLTLIAVPTQLSHDGICSPVSVVPNDEGRAESLGAIEPRAVYLSMPTLVKAPVSSVAAGIGDLIANPLALRDWALAAERGLEEIDEQAWNMSIESYQMIESYLDTDPVDSLISPRFVRDLAQALILSGVAMIHSGTSRPASGGEHEISHAIDQLFGGRAMHGAQVAFGCIFSVELYGDDSAAFRRRLERLGLPSHPKDLDLSEDDVVRILLEAPETRPGRFTILEDSDLDESAARALAKRVFY
jgi:glycerol-1-phosphate dehydrogenase [NAD(P)+]